MHRENVSYGPPLAAELAIEPIADTAGSKLRGGSGASCWGYNQSNIVRCGEQLYALSWHDDLTLVVYRRIGPGQWAASKPLPSVPQNGNLLVDAEGQVHVISGANASWHAIFDPELRDCQMLQNAEADSRFGAAINVYGQIFAAGGL